MNKLRVAFWNVENAFHWRSGIERGPQSPAEYTAKVRKIATVITELFGPERVDVIGLSEIGTKPVLSDIVDALPKGYQPVWASPGHKQKTGLALLFRPQALTLLSKEQFPRASVVKDEKTRPKYVNVIFEHSATGTKLLVSVNHWSANRKGVTASVVRDRVTTARTLADQFLNNNEYRQLPILVMGDFNVNPYDGVFDSQRLRGHQSFSTIDRWRSPSAEFFNPCWKYLSPPEAISISRQALYREARPQRSISLGGDHVYDQVLVSKSFILHPKIKFCDSELRFFTSASVSRYGDGGRLVPNRWREPKKAWKPLSGGASDHFPMLLTFEIK